MVGCGANFLFPISRHESEMQREFLSFLMIDDHHISQYEVPHCLSVVCVRGAC